MGILVTDYLEESYKKFPDKIAFSDERKSVTFAKLREDSMKIATYFAEKNTFKKPIVIFLDKGVDVLVSFMGTLYSGNFYTPIDPQMPEERVQKIVETLNPEYIITSKIYAEDLKNRYSEKQVLVLEEILAHPGNEELVYEKVHKIIDTDIAYVLFTSGSTGVPKGAIVSHRAVITYIEWVSDVFAIDEKTIIGNQTPFYFSMSVFDIFVTLRNACTTHIIPHSMFSKPKELIEYINQKRVNLIYWVPSVLMQVANTRAFDTIKADYLKKVLFAGEVMPTKQLNYWIGSLNKDVIYANLFGPTEVTDICTYYVVDRELCDDESLPIGRACNNTDVIVLDGQNQLVEEDSVGVEGELCVRGSSLAYGYYNNKEKTEEVFVQNPINSEYREIIYRTGDLVKYNSNRELIYIGRKDFQIKVSGYRIELGEIETAISAIPQIESSCCLFDDAEKRIICVYKGAIEKTALRKELKKSLLRYMMPHQYIKLDDMPLNDNGKINRKELIKHYVSTDRG